MKNEYVIVCEGFGDGSPCPVAGQYLKTYDPEAFNGGGEAIFTDKIEEAMKFDNVGKAFELWKTQSKVKPLREDGLPNRPLTAFSISTISVAETQKS